MTGQRMTTIRTWSGGVLTILCPEWCTGHPDVPTHPTDVAHTGQPVVFEEHGEQVMGAFLSAAPFRTGDKGAPGPVAVVRLHDHHEMSVQELGEFADSLTAYAEQLRHLAAELAGLQREADS